MSINLSTPTPGGSNNTWGDTLNADLLAIQNAINALGSLSTVSPSGTRDGTKFLRDDYTWQTIASLAGTLARDATTRTSNFTASANKIYSVDLTSANVTATLPAAPANTTQVMVQVTGWADPHVLTVAAGSGDTFVNGSNPTRGLGVGQSVWVQYDSTSKTWMQIADRLPISVLDTRYAIASALADIATSGFASDLTGTLTLDQLPPGSVFQIDWSGTAWEYAGSVITARPTSRSDLRMKAMGGSSPPPFQSLQDSWEKDNSL